MAQVFDGLAQCLPLGGEAILDMGWHLGEGLTFEDAGQFQFAQPHREHLGARLGDGAAQFTETLGTPHHLVDEQEGPFATQGCEGQLDVTDIITCLCRDGMF